MRGDGGLNQRTSRGGGYGRETGIIDLGHEPPLSVDGSEAAVIDRRRVSVQWFSGTILTGLCGAALIGGAVFASLDDEMRVRPFIRISGNLSMTTSDLSAKIPPFNAQRMLTDVGSAAPAAADDPNNPDAAEPDAEVSFVTKDLAPILPKAKVAAVVALDEIILRVRDASNWRGNSGGVRYTLANATADANGVQSDIKLAYATEGNVSADPYAGFETRVVPENVTLLPKTKDQVTGGNPNG